MDTKSSTQAQSENEDHGAERARALDLWAFQLLEETSQRIAYRVSDGPGQLLANSVFELAASVQLMDDNPQVAKEGLLALEEELRVGLRAIQYLVAELDPTLLGELGLVPAIRSYITRFQQQSGLRVHLEIESPPDRLPNTMELMVFRILQEALNNVQHHAAATQAWVTLRVTPEFIELSVEDDGRGLDMERIAVGRQRHLGLVSMHDRARVISGSLEIGNRPSGGARVYLHAPR